MDATHHVVRSKDELIKLYSEDQLVEFLYVHLEQYGDPREQIQAALDYAFSDAEGKGGYVVLQEINDELTGAVVMIRTGMKGYIPENILVYLATDSSKAPLGAGAEVAKKALDEAEGDVALHVEYENSAKKLYHNLGFTSKYAEMRYVKK